MAKKKKIEEIDVNALGVSGEPDKKKKKSNNRGCGCLILIAVLFGIFAAAGGSKKTDTTPLAAAIVATSTPLGEGFKTFTPTVTPYPDVTMTATEPATQDEEIASLEQLPAVTSVDYVARTGTDYVAVVKTQPNFNKASFADLLLIQAIAVDLYITRMAVQIDDGSSEPLWWAWVDNKWASTKEAPAWVNLGSIALPIATTAPTFPAVVVATVAATTSAITNITPKTYYAQSTSNVRSCEKLNCSIVLTLKAGDAVTITGSIEGDLVRSSRKWYRVKVGNIEGYVFNDLVNVVKPSTASSGGSSTGGSTGGDANGGQSVTPIQEPPKVWDCSGDIYNCGSFASRADMRSYFDQCPGDPSKLDGDGDGSYCE